MQHPASTDWRLIALLLAWGLLLAAWIGSFEIEYGDRWLRYRYLFGKIDEIPIDEIVSLNFAMGVTRYTDRFLPLVRLQVTWRETEHKRRTEINVKVFERESMCRLIAFIEHARPGLMGHG